MNVVMPSAYTSMTAQIPDPHFREFLTGYFPVEPVAEFVTWLVHKQTTLNGETFQVGGGRVARVVMAEASGLNKPTGLAEDWQGSEAALLDLQGIGAPASMMEEIRFQVANMPANVVKAFASVDLDRDWSG